ncbi:MAG: FAD-binding protein [Cetobacterium sp.]
MKRMFVVFGPKNVILNQLKELNSFFIKNFENNKKVDLLIFSWESIDINECKIPTWVENIFYTYNKKFIISEIYLDILENFLSDNNYEMLIFPSDYFSNNICVRISKRLNYENINFINSIKFIGDKYLVSKNIYSTNLVGEFEIFSNKICVSIEKNAKVEYLESYNYNLIKLDLYNNYKNNFVLDFSITQKELKNRLEDSKFVIVVGKGIGSKEEVQKIEKTFEAFDYKLGGTRPVVMNGWIPLENLVGVSGTIISPNLCLIVGASGQRALLSGIIQSKKIIAINIDKDVEINKQADYIFNLDYKIFMKKIEEIVARRLNE